MKDGNFMLEMIDRKHTSLKKCNEKLLGNNKDHDYIDHSIDIV